MGRLNWSIFDGAEFESLVHSVLFFTEPGIMLCGRPGKDGGQDAISADRTHVYQAKYGRTLSGDEAIKRAKEELENIKVSRKPDHPNYRFWSKVTHWTLVANFEQNPWDIEKWQKEIVDEYSNLHLQLECWDATKLEALLTNLPDVEQAYFGGKNRAFIGLSEACRFLEQGKFGKYYFDSKLHGRDAQNQTVDAFAEDTEHRFLIVHGQAGTGKSRFLYEAAVRLSEKNWRVFWGLPDSMSCSDAWMRGINGSSTRTCLVIDSPAAATLVNAVYEQLSTEEKGSWKAIVSCSQSEFNDWFGEKQLQSNTQHIELEALPEAAAKEMINELVKKSDIILPEHAAAQIYSLSRGVPGWISLLLGYSRENGKVIHLYPELLQAVSVQIRKAMEKWDAPTRTRRLQVLRWICAWKKVVFEGGGDDMNPIISFLGNELHESSEQLCADFQNLADKGLLSKWGRLRTCFSAEPSLVRQHVLCEWLLEKDENAYRISAFGREFIRRLIDSEIPGKETVVKNLAALSSCYLAPEQRMDFFRPITDELMNLADRDDVTQQMAVFDWAKRISSMTPETALDIVQKIWDKQAPPKVVKNRYWGDRKIEHAQILEQVAPFLYSLTLQSRTKALSGRVWRAFERIYQEERSGAYTPSSGEKAEELILRLLRKLGGGEQFRVLACEELTRHCQQNEFGPFDAIVANGLLSSKRETVESWGRRFTFIQGYIQPDTLDWNRAMNTRNLLFELLSQNRIPSSGSEIWTVLANAHLGWIGAGFTNPQTVQSLGPHYRRIALEDLQRTLKILKLRGDSLNIPELEAARRLWENELNCEDLKEEKTLANACEEEYTKHFKWNYAELFTWDDNNAAMTAMLQQVRDSFATAASPQPIAAFFEEASEFLKAKNPEQPDTDYGRSYNLAAACLDLYVPSSGNAFSDFVDESIKKPLGNNSFRWRFFIFFFRMWICNCKSRNLPKNIVEEIRRLVGTAEEKERLLASAYGGASSQEIGSATREEMDYLCSEECHFDNGQLASVLPTFLPVDAEGVLRRLKRVLDDEREKKQTVENVWWSFVGNAQRVVLLEQDCRISKLIEWLVESVGEYGISGNCFERFEFRGLAHACGYRMSQKSFAALIERRIELAENGKKSANFVFMPYEFDVARWVSPTTDDTAIQDLCRLTLVRKTYFAIYELPKYFAALDKNAESVSHFIGTYLAARGGVEPWHLRRLGSLASSYEERSDAWQKIVMPICRYMNENDVPRDERYSVYHSFQKSMEFWSAVPGEVPSVFIDKEIAARKAKDETPRSSDMYEYYVWAHNLAEWELKREQEYAEEERHD